jgi:4-oxalocrotonate tautomerase
MPYLNLKLGVDASTELAERAATTLTQLTAKRLGKKRELTSVQVEFVPRAHWFIAGTSVQSGGSSTFYLDVKITEGTNTKDQKAVYMREVFAALESLLGPVQPASYIVLHELRADTWGHAGETQERRYARDACTRTKVTRSFRFTPMPSTRTPSSSAGAFRRLTQKVR